MNNIIVGGTRGLGSEIAKQFQIKGEKTFIVGRSFDPSLHGEGFKVDLASSKEANQLAERILSLGDTAISFYWVSGYGYNGDFTSQPDPERMAAANFGNVLLAAQAAFKRMISAPEPSHFVVVSSTTGYKAREDEAVYSGTKHAQVGFTRSLGIESDRLGSKVKVALFMPGGMKTSFWEGKQPSNFDEFLDPAKVARHILIKLANQSNTYYEEVIERGSL